MSYFNFFKVSDRNISSLIILLFFSFFFSENSIAQITIMDEDFSGQTLPTGWSNIDNGSSGQIWQFNDPGSRAVGTPFDGDFAILDSDNYGSGNSQNASLETASFDASSYNLTLNLEYDFQYRECCSSTIIVEVYNGTSWSTVRTHTGNPNYSNASSVTSESIDIRTAAGGSANAKVRFTYTGSYAWWFAMDNFKVTGTMSVPLADADGDGVGDVDDLDSDNDGIPNVLEKACDDSSIANSTSGSGAYQDKLYFFSWSGGDFNDGIQDGDSQTFNLANGLSITATFSNVVNGGTYVPTDMNTWGGAYLHQLYNTAGADEALYGADAQDASFTVTFVATKNGLPFSLDILALDAESTNNTNESISFVTNGGNWTVLETYGNGGVWTGVNTTTIQTTDTEQSGGNTIFYSEDASVLDFTIDAGGREGIALGIILFCDEDGDGLPNYLDLDSDNDGIPDIIEAGGVDTNGDGVVDYPTPNDPTTMIDVDGIADSIDDQDSGSGVGEVTSGTALPNEDTDGDGLEDIVDLDADNDGIPDIVEMGGVDSNGDGIVDNLLDNDSDGFADVYDPDDDGTPGVDSGEGTQPLVETDGSGNDLNGETGVSLDSDGDGLADNVDLDADNDGIPDLVEAGGVDSNGDGLVDVNTDLDKDGLADIFDTDDDGLAGIEDGTDALLMTGGTDTDGDGKADDLAITFTDGDGNSADTDNDGFVDHLDLDADNDGIPDIVEAGGSTPNNDGKVDILAAPWDSDNDGLADIYDENNSGTSLVKTTSDTNADGKINATESMTPGGSNIINTDADPYPNHLDLDADNDGITDVVENAGGVFSADHSSGTLDGVVGDNATVTDTDNNGWHDPSTTTTTDSDGDNIPDYLDIDADNDGIVDYLEGVCSTCPTFTLNPISNPTDANGNGVLDIYESLTSANGSSGSNIGATPNVDDDSGNSTPDYLDTDSDGDGANDWTEGYDINDNGQAADDLMTMATTYETATSNGYYVNATDTDSDGIPDWLDNQPSVAGYDESTRPPFLNPVSAFWHDDDNDGLVDLLDSSQNGTAAPTPDNNGGNDLDWRDFTALVSLPVELSSFFVTERDCIVELNWTTASEENFDYFEIQWSGDGHEFERVNWVASNGNANGDSYKSIDNNPSTHNYYRLKMMDFDGKFEFSKVVYIKLDCASTQDEILVYPNPIMPSQPLNIEFLSKKEMEQIVVIDVMGRIVKRVSIGTEVGKNTLSLDISDLAIGTYMLQLVGSKYSKMILIQE